MLTKTLTLDQLLLTCAGATIEGALYLEQHYFFPDSVRIPCPPIMVQGKFAASPGLRHLTCDKCQGRSWTPNHNPYAWRQALRERGWSLYIESDPRRPGDALEIYISRDLPTCRVSHFDGIRDQLAEMEAIRRMLEKVPGIDKRTESTAHE